MGVGVCLFSMNPETVKSNATYPFLPLLGPVFPALPSRHPVPNIWVPGLLLNVFLLLFSLLSNFYIFFIVQAVTTVFASAIPNEMSRVLGKSTLPQSRAPTRILGMHSSGVNTDQDSPPIKK